MAIVIFGLHRARWPNQLSIGLACGRLWVQTHDQVKPMTYKIDTCHFLAMCLALLGYGKDWLAQYQDNDTEWDTRSMSQWHCFPVGQYY